MTPHKTMRDLAKAAPSDEAVRVIIPSKITTEQKARAIYDVNRKYKHDPIDGDLFEVIIQSLAFNCGEFIRAATRPSPALNAEVVENVKSAIIILIGDVLYMADRANEPRRFRDTIEKAECALQLLEAAGGGV